MAIEMSSDRKIDCVNSFGISKITTIDLSYHLIIVQIEKISHTVSHIESRDLNTIMKRTAQLSQNQRKLLNETFHDRFGQVWSK